MRPVFLYGSLRHPGLLEVVLGRPLGPGCIEPARAADHAAYRHARADYPILRPVPGAVAEGTLFRPATPRDLERLVFYEQAEYDLAGILALTAAGPVDALYFLARPGAEASRVLWDFAAWRDTQAALAIEAAREFMDHHGRVAAAEIGGLWPGMVNRARARLGAAASAPRADAPPLRTGFTAARDVEEIERRRAWTGYLAVDEHVFRHRRHDGGWTRPLARTSVSWGDAVTILPYDPHTDRVLLIEQFRPGPVARGDPSPWCVEVIAGRLDTAEEPEATARREAWEEAGLRIGRIVRIAGYYPTPGLASEHIAAFVGEADLTGAGGIHGLDAEGEDIRSVALGLDDALAALDRAAVDAGPALVSLLWLARHRERLRAEWGGGPPPMAQG